MSEDLTYVVPEAYAQQRADKALAAGFTHYSRQQLKSVFLEGKVRRDGVALSPRTRVHLGDVLLFKAPVLKSLKLEPADMQLDCVHEDEDLLVLNKPSGILVHPGAGNHGPTLVEGVMAYLGPKWNCPGGPLRPGVVHRLDKDTSGLIVFAKTQAAWHGLVEAFSKRLLKKFYEALLVGAPELNAGVLQDPIGRHSTHRVKMAVRPDGRDARTDWKVLRRFAKQYTWMHFRPHSGRTHQIRVHAASWGHPLWGDTLYGGAQHQRPPRKGKKTIKADAAGGQKQAKAERLRGEKNFGGDAAGASAASAAIAPSGEKNFRGDALCKTAMPTSANSLGKKNSEADALRKTAEPIESAASAAQVREPQRFFLHARALELRHPISKAQLAFELPLPKTFERQLKAWELEFGSEP